MSVVLVTGSEGSLMKEVVPKLLSNGHEVVGVDNLFKSKRKPSDLGKNYTFIEGDLTDPKVAEYAMSGVDSVIQAAARIYGVTGFHKNCADILGEDITLHNNVLKAAVKHNVKHVTYISSSMVYEGVPKANKFFTLQGVKEESALQHVPSTDYGLSKFTGERLSLAFKSQYDIDYTIWRPFNLITPYEISEGEQGFSHVFADFIKNIVFEKQNMIPIIGDGTQIRCFTWINEVAQAIADFQTDTRAKNESFNLGNKEPINMISLANTIYDTAYELEMLEGEKKELAFSHIEPYKDDVKIRIPNIDKVFNNLGWKAEILVNESVRRCLMEIKNQ